MGFKEKLQKNSHISREKKLWQEAEKIHGELYISLWQIAAHGDCNLFASKIKAKCNKSRLPDGILSEGKQKGLGNSQQAKNRKWVLICCACSLPKTRKGRERNGKETQNQRRANRCKKSTLSRIAHTRSYNSIRQDVLSFYGKL